MSDHLTAGESSGIRSRIRYEHNEHTSISWLWISLFLDPQADERAHVHHEVRRKWALALDYAELLDLNRRFLCRKLKATAYQNGGIYAETDALVPSLLRLHDFGILTTMSSRMYISRSFYPISDQCLHSWKCCKSYDSGRSFQNVSHNSFSHP